MCAAGDIPGQDPQRSVLVAELMAEASELRALGMKLVREVSRQVDEDPSLALDASLQFQRVAATVTRIGGFQLLLLEKDGTLLREAEEARRRRDAAHERSLRRRGAERKMQCAYLFDRHAIAPIEEGGGSFSADEARRGLFDWLFDTDRPERFADMRVGDIMIDITRTLGLKPNTDNRTLEEWEDGVRARWAPLDDILQGFDPHCAEFPISATGP